MVDNLAKDSSNKLRLEISFDIAPFLFIVFLIFNPSGFIYLMFQKKFSSFLR